MQKEKNFTQNVNIRTDACMDGRKEEQKDENYIPLDILSMLGV